MSAVPCLEVEARPVLQRVGIIHPSFLIAMDPGQTRELISALEAALRHLGKPIGDPAPDCDSGIGTWSVETYFSG